MNNILDDGTEVTPPGNHRARIVSHACPPGGCDSHRALHRYWAWFISGPFTSPDAAGPRERLIWLAPTDRAGPKPAADDRGGAEVLCGDRNLCARPYRHAGECKSFDGATWQATP